MKRHISYYFCFHFKATVNWEDGKLITTAKPTEGSKAKATRVERRIEGDQLIMVGYVYYISASL